jgi:hypothetical protein
MQLVLARAGQLMQTPPSIPASLNFDSERARHHRRRAARPQSAVESRRKGCSRLAFLS